jgi:hypothetical protein
MRSLVRRRAALGAAVFVLVAVASFAVPTCGDASEPVRPIVLDGGAQEASPGEEGSDGGPARGGSSVRAEGEHDGQAGDDTDEASDKDDDIDEGGFARR